MSNLILFFSKYSLNIQFTPLTCLKDGRQNITTNVIKMAPLMAAVGGVDGFYGAS